MTFNVNDGESAKGAGNESADPPKGDVCVLDMGKHPRKRIRQLRRGKGKLMYKVECAIDDLREDGVLSSSAQTVIVIIREERAFGGLFAD